MGSKSCTFTDSMLLCGESISRSASRSQSNHSVWWQRREIVDDGCTWRPSWNSKVERRDWDPHHACAKGECKVYFIDFRVYVSLYPEFEKVSQGLSSFNTWWHWSCRAICFPAMTLYGLHAIWIAKSLPVYRCDIICASSWCWIAISKILPIIDGTIEATTSCQEPTSVHVFNYAGALSCSWLTIKLCLAESGNKAERCFDICNWAYYCRDGLDR